MWTDETHAHATVPQEAAERGGRTFADVASARGDNDAAAGAAAAAVAVGAVGA